ncbi:MAG: VOC family protein [Pseudomonadota bacterium]
MTIADVTYLVPRFEAGAAFLTDVLAYRDLTREPAWPVFAPTRHAGATLRLAEPKPGEAAAIGRQAGSRVFLFLRVADMAAECAALARAGHPIEEPLRHEPYGAIVVIRDPFGNRWDIIEPA